MQGMCGYGKIIKNGRVQQRSLRFQAETDHFPRTTRPEVSEFLLRHRVFQQNVFFSFLHFHSIFLHLQLL